MIPIIHTTAVLVIERRHRVRASKYLVIATPLEFERRQQSAPETTRSARTQSLHIYIKNASTLSINICP